MYTGKTRKEKVSGPGEKCQRNVTDLAGSLVTSSRPPGRLQKRPDDRTSNAGVAVRRAAGSRRTADAGDEQCLRCGCSSPSYAPAAIRSHRQHAVMMMRAIVTDLPCSVSICVVCACVCLLVRTVSNAKIAEPIDIKNCFQ